ncbi:hypothetical protein [Sphingosinicella terrae]|uniref:hypothetical protein n=1 Tax=Sphingosinicella terrae TaxID=2172047 RepID=UPI000E0D2900|nr:hypothetical protein [Sphingosinicella terrae]
MRKNFRRTAAICLALACAGCASDGVIVDARGALPSRGTFAFVDGDERESVALEAGMAARLRARGLIPAEEADYLVDIGAAERRAGTGALLPTRGEPQQWLRAPDLARRRVGVRTVAIAVSDRAGQEVYRASASARAGSDDGAWDTLIEHLTAPRPGEAGLP